MKNRAMVEANGLLKATIPLLAGMLLCDAGQAQDKVSIDRTFTAPRTATQDVDLLNGKAAVSIDPNLWKEMRPPEIDRRTFRHVSGHGYAVFISEQIELSLDQVRQIALDNAHEAAPDIRIIEEQRRRVNGTDVLLLRLEGNTSGAAVTYLGYYYGGPEGMVRVFTYTGQNLFQKYRRDFEDLLNGFRLKE